MRTCFFQRPRPLAIMSFPKCFTDTTLSPGVGCFDSASWQPLHGVDVVTQRGGRGCYLPVKPQLWVPAGNLMMNDFNCFFFWCTVNITISSRLCLRKTLESVLSLLGSALKAFAVAPEHLATLPPWALSKELSYYLLYFVCLYKLWYEIWENWHWHYHVMFILCLDYGNLSCSCLHCYHSRKCLRYSDLVTRHLDSVSLALTQIHCLPA